MNAIDRAAWLAQRRAGIGASDLAAVLGISPWKTPLELYLDKRGELPPQADNPTLRRGRLLEPLVLDFYTDETGRPVTRQQEHIVDDWKMATLDGFDAFEQAPVEAKTVNAFAAREFGANGSDDVPLHYAAQVHWQMMLTKSGVGYLAALIGSDDFRIFELKRDRDLEQMLVARANEFWHRVLDGRPPEPTSEADVRLLYPRDAGSQITATQDIADSVLQLAGVKEQLKTLEQHETELVGKIKTYLGEHAVLIDPAGRALATWKSAKPTKKTDYKAVVDALCELHRDNADLMLNIADILETNTATIAGTRRFLLKESSL